MAVPDVICEPLVSPDMLMASTFLALEESMRCSKIRSIVGAFVLCVSGLDAPVEAINETKIILGSCMIGGGSALTIHYVNSHLFGDEGEWEPIVGIALVGCRSNIFDLGSSSKRQSDQ
jgi:hypothetical protein